MASRTRLRWLVKGCWCIAYPLISTFGHLLDPIKHCKLYRRFECFRRMICCWRHSQCFCRIYAHEDHLVTFFSLSKIPRMSRLAFASHRFKLVSFVFEGPKREFLLHLFLHKRMHQDQILEEGCKVRQHDLLSLHILWPKMLASSAKFQPFQLLVLQAFKMG